MPVITEEDYLSFADAINSPAATEDDIKSFGSLMKQYEDQQKLRNKPLLPSVEKQKYETHQRAMMQIDDLYSGIDKVAIPDNVASLFDTPEKRARYANTSYLKYKYNKDFTSEEYDLYKADFANKFLNGEQPASDLSLYDSIKNIRTSEKSAENKAQFNFKQAAEVFTTGESANDAIARLSKANPNEFNASAFTDNYNKINNIISVYKPDLDKFAAAMQRKMTEKLQPTDEQTISNFNTMIAEMPEEERMLSFIYLRNKAGKMGADYAQTRGLFNAIADDFSKSFQRVYSEGFAGIGAFEAESTYARIKRPGSIVATAIPKIDSVEAANAYVNEQVDYIFRERNADRASAASPSGIPVPVEKPQNAVERTISPEEMPFIRQALKERQKGLDISRQISSIGAALDPVGDNIAGIMAGTTGSSAALMLPMVVSPLGGTVLAGQVFRGANYEQLRAKYPNMTPEEADFYATLAGAGESAVELMQVNTMGKIGARMAKAFQTKTLAGTSGMSLIGTLLLNAGKGYVVENIQEGVQDALLPVVEGIASSFSDVMPEFDAQKELGNWWNTRADVAIGLIPLSVFGVAGSSATKYYSDKKLMKDAADVEKLLDIGITEPDRTAIADFVANQDYQGLVDFFPQAYNRRDREAAQQRVMEKQLDALLSVDSAAALNQAIQANVIPDFKPNADGTFTAINYKGKDVVLKDREEVQAFIQTSIDASIKAKQEIINNETVDAANAAQQAQITTDLNEADAQNDALAKLQGAKQQDINANNAAFGDKVQQQRVFSQTVRDLFSGNKTTSQVVDDYINGVYRNLPQSTRDALGADEAAGKQNLANIVKGIAPAVAAPTTRRTVGVRGLATFDTLQQLTKQNEFKFIGITPETGFDWKRLSAAGQQYRELLAKPDVTQQEIDDFVAQFGQDKATAESALKFASALNAEQIGMIEQLQQDFDADYLIDQNKPAADRKFQGRPIVRIALPKAPQPGTAKDEADFAIAWLTSFKELFGSDVMLYDVVQEGVFDENNNQVTAPISTDGMYQAVADTIMVNVGGIGALPWTVGHEYMHRIRAHYPDVYDQIVEVIKSYVTPQQRNSYYVLMPPSYFTNSENSAIRSEAVKARMLAEQQLAKLDATDAANADKIKRLQKEIDDANKDIDFVDAEAEKLKKDYIATKENQRQRKFTQKWLGFERVPKQFLGVYDKHPITKKIADAIEEEFYADFFASNFMDPDFWQQIESRSNPSLFKRFIESLKAYIENLISTVDKTRISGADVIRDIKEQVKASNADALNQMYSRLREIIDFDRLNLAQFPQRAIVARGGAAFGRYSKSLPSGRTARELSDEIQTLINRLSKVDALVISPEQQAVIDRFIVNPIKKATGNAPNIIVGKLAYDTLTPGAPVSTNTSRYIDAYNKFISDFAQRFDINILFFKRLDAAAPNEPAITQGLYDPETTTIFINVDSEVMHQVVLGHEFGHFIQFRDPPLYEKLKKSIIDVISNKNVNEYIKLTQQINDEYFKVPGVKLDYTATRAAFEQHARAVAAGTKLTAKNAGGLSFTDYSYLKNVIDAEVSNDAFGYIFTDKKLWEDLAAKDANLFEKLMQYFKDFIDKFYLFVKNTYTNNIALEEITGQQLLEQGFEVAIAVNDYENMRSILVEAMKGLSKTSPIFRALTGLGNQFRSMFTPVTPNASAMRPRAQGTAAAPNAQVEHVASKIRDTVALAQVAAQQAKQRGETRTGAVAEEADVEATLAEIVAPIDEASFNAAAQQRAETRNSMRMRNSLRKAVFNGDVSLNALANAAAVVNGTYADVANLTDVEKTEYINKALETADEYFKQSEMDRMRGYSAALSQLANNIRSTNPQGAKFADHLAEALEMTDASEQAAALFDKLYTADGIPVAKDIEEYADNLLRYNIIKTVANWRNMTFDQLQVMNKQLTDIINAPTKSNEFLRSLQNSITFIRQEAQTSASLSKREQSMFDKMNAPMNPILKGAKKILQPLVDMMKSFSDSHLTFASLVELVFPNDANATKKLYKEIADLQKTINDPNADELAKEAAQYELSQKQKLIGKAITPEMQKIVDDVRNAYTQVLIDNEANEQMMRETIARIYGIKPSAMRVNRALYDLMDRTVAPGKAFYVTINGRQYSLSQSYAAYILNLQESRMYNAQLTANGFTAAVLADIRSKISKEANALRIELRKNIIKEHKKVNDMSLKTFGIGSVVPPDVFFPVQRKSTPSALVDAFDINFQGGITNQDMDQVLSENDQIELDLNEQAINLLSMYNSHMYLTTFQRNVKAPVSKAKAVLLDKVIADKITSAFGNDFYNQLYKLLNGLETNGVRSTEMNRTWRKYMRGFMGAFAKGALALNPTTIFLNMTSFFNAALDASIPANKMMMSYIRGVASLMTAGQMGAGLKMSPKQIRQMAIMQQRIKGGANNLLAISKTDPTVDKPGAISAAGDFGLRPISYADGFMGSIAAAVAYDAHYKMAIDAGMSEADAVKAAEQGMKRTIQTTFQPNTVAGKSTVEMNSNVVMRMLGMFMSEARKAVGLEITAFKKGANGLGWSEFLRIAAVNHFIIGGLSFFIRAGITDLLNDEEEDEDIWNPAELAKSIMIGPLAGLFLVGNAAETVASKTLNFLIQNSDWAQDAEIKKLPSFPRDNMFAQTANQMMRVVDLFDEDKELTEDEMADRIINAGKALSAVLNNNFMAGATTIAKAGKSLVDFIDENVVDIMEEPQ